MKKGQNHNRPEKGSQIKVEPIRSTKDIETIKKLLADRPRDLALFVIGINTNLRSSDLLNLRVAQVVGLKPLDEIEIKEKKTGKLRRISLNKACVTVIEGLLASRRYRDTDYLFQSQRSAVLTVPSVNRLVKGWCRAINLKGNYGSHTLRNA